MKESYTYLVSTGWWCDFPESVDTRDVLYGASDIREKEFFAQWFDAVNRFTSPKKILVVDSASPVTPELPDDSRLEWLRLDENAGHSTNHTGDWAGVTRAHIAGMTYALSCNVDYWVYIEQDALIYGDGIVEFCIESMRKGIMFGGGEGTPHPMQQSFMIMHRSEISGFLDRLARISARDNVIPPEMKFAMSATRYAKYLPEWAFYQSLNGSKFRKEISRFLRRLLRKFQGFDSLPIGYGRIKPVNFADRHFYFQHGSTAELEEYVAKCS